MSIECPRCGCLKGEKSELCLSCANKAKAADRSARAGKAALTSRRNRKPPPVTLAPRA